ncbi:hypothetical protein DdX_03314 [Ditylenchus destructor]|uniref:Uncharacterized protein n=1 Tax=Ditylenchus destructor TaxID=166010 RepID=A0AAD4NJ38_9BILA|nr:hypothetical protein DdX_03314 [Ditylenchus destructor]
MRDSLPPREADGVCITDASHNRIGSLLYDGVDTPLCYPTTNTLGKFRRGDTPTHLTAAIPCQYRRERRENVMALLECDAMRDEGRSVLREFNGREMLELKDKRKNRREWDNDYTEEESRHGKREVHCGPLPINASQEKEGSLTENQL